MASRVTPHLLFDGVAEEAMTLYVSLFRNSEVLDVSKYGAEGPGPEGTIMVARFTVAGREFQCADSPMKHDFTFTPSMSIFVDCESQEELDAAFEKLAADGQVLMPLGNYGFSARFGWVNDRFGVSWQLNLP